MLSEARQKIFRLIHTRRMTFRSYILWLNHNIFNVNNCRKCMLKKLHSHFLWGPPASGALTSAVRCHPIAPPLKHWIMFIINRRALFARKIIKKQLKILILKGTLFCCGTEFSSMKEGINDSCFSKCYTSLAYS